jgi:hypothetical protein
VQPNATADRDAAAVGRHRAITAQMGEPAADGLDGHAQIIGHVDSGHRQIQHFADNRAGSAASGYAKRSINDAATHYLGCEFGVGEFPWCMCPGSMLRCAAHCLLSFINSNKRQSAGAGDRQLRRRSWQK